MILTDILLAIAAIAGLCVFLGIIVSFVPSPDLMILVGVVVLMVVADFVIEIARKIRNRR